MKTRPDKVMDCWFVTSDELKAVVGGSAFRPLYTPYVYFRLEKRLDKDNLEGFIGRDDHADDFHNVINPTYSYFTDYQAQCKVYVTMDKTIFYEIKEIFPEKPLLFMLKKVPAQPAADLSPLLPPISGTIHRLPFQMLGGELFERLVFAYVNETTVWKDIQWLGETGKDRGRDIWAVGADGSYCYQCANYQQLTFKKVSEDMDKLVKNGSIPQHLVIVCGGKVSDQLRSKIKFHAQKNKIPTVAVWSGSELEESLRKYAPTVLKRFFQSIPFPEELPIENGKQKVAEEPLPVLELALAPKLRFIGTDEELGVFIAESFYNLEKGIAPAVEISILEEKVLHEKAALFSNAPKTVNNRNELLALKKIIDLLTNLKIELADKIRLMFLADLYPLKNDFQVLAGCLRELLKLSYDGRRLYDETDLLNFMSIEEPAQKALKFEGKWKIDIYRAIGNKPGFSIWLSDAEFEGLKSKLPASVSLKDLVLFGFETSDLDISTLAKKVIPAFVDKIYDLHKRNEIDINDKNSWAYLPLYVLGMG